MSSPKRSRRKKSKSGAMKPKRTSSSKSKQLAAPIHVQRPQRTYLTQTDEIVYARFMKWETHGLGPKVYLHFSIVEPASWEGQRVYFACNITALIGPAGKHGVFEIHPSSKLYDTLSRLEYPPDSLGEEGLYRLKRGIFRITLRTVTKDRNNKRRKEEDFYTVVDDLVEFIEDE